MNPEFTASTQYNDWQGSLAADNADDNDIWDRLRNQGHITANEFLVGIDFYVLSGIKSKTITVRCLILSLQNGQTVDEVLAKEGPVQVKEVELDFTPNDFFELFKRFNGTLSQNKIFEGREYTII